jgi:hypothetical protein
VSSNRLIRFVFEAIIVVAIAVVLASVGVGTAAFIVVIAAVLAIVVGAELVIFGLRPPRPAVDEGSLPLHEGGVVRDEPEQPLPAPEPPEEAPLEPETQVVAVVEPEPEPEPVPEPPALVVVPAPPPEPSVVVEPPPAAASDGASVVELPYRGGPREWNLWDLERRAREQAGRDPWRDEEWQALFVYLREYASPDGMLPADFDDLVRQSFGELLTTSAR